MSETAVSRAEPPRAAGRDEDARTNGRAGPMIVVEDLYKHYGATPAVDGISFIVERGETFGLLGPNGAGKSTTLSILCGLLRPDRGEAWIGGISVRHSPRAAQALIGVVPQSLALYEDLSARQNLNYFAKLRGVPRSERAAEIERVLKIVALDDASTRRVSSYSGGMKRRLNIAIGLLGNPRVLLLDEPTVGIDPQSRRHILDSVRSLAQLGMTIIYSSHYMEEVEYLCDRVAIMDRGKIIAQGHKDEVRALAGDSVTLVLPNPASTLENGFDLEALGRSVGVPVEATSAELRFVLPKGSAQAPEILNTLRDLGVPLDGMRLETPNLETVFLSLTGKALRDGQTGESGGVSA